MKYWVLVFALFTTLVACDNTQTNKAANGNQGNGGSPADPNNTKPIFAGKPGNFNGSWRGDGLVENSAAKTRVPVVTTVIVKQTIDATTGLPTDISLVLTMVDKIGDIVYSASLSGFNILTKEVNKTTFIYEIYETATKIKLGEIGQQAFSLHHVRSGRKINIDVNAVSMSVLGFKIVNNNKTTFKSTLRKTH